MARKKRVVGSGYWPWIVARDPHNGYRHKVYSGAQFEVSHVNLIFVKGFTSRGEALLHAQRMNGRRNNPGQGCLSCSGPLPQGYMFCPKCEVAVLKNLPPDAIKKVIKKMKLGNPYARRRIRDPRRFKKSTYATLDIGRKGATQLVRARDRKSGRFLTQAVLFEKGRRYSPGQKRRILAAARRNPLRGRGRPSILYDNVERIEMTKGRNAHPRLRGKAFFHDFGRPGPQAMAIPRGTQVHIPGKGYFRLTTRSALLTGKKDIYTRQRVPKGRLR
jgi:hypothetical protein